MCSSDQWSSGSTGQCGERGVVHCLPKGRPRRAPRSLLRGGCRRAGSTSGAERPPTAAALRRAELDNAVAEVFEASSGRYGSPRPRRTPPGGLEGVGKDGGGLHGPIRPGGPPKARFRCLTRQDKTAKAIPDLLKRDFDPAAINKKWCGDLTELPTEEGKLYLASVPGQPAHRPLCHGRAPRPARQGFVTDGRRYPRWGREEGGHFRNKVRDSQTLATYSYLGVTQSIGGVVVL